MVLFFCFFFSGKSALFLTVSHVLTIDYALLRCVRVLNLSSLTRLYISALFSAFNMYPLLNVDIFFFITNKNVTQHSLSLFFFFNYCFCSSTFSSIFLLSFSSFIVYMYKYMYHDIYMYKLCLGICMYVCMYTV